MTEQAGHIDRARGQKDGHQHLVHRGLRGPPVESLAKHGRDSAKESQSLFFGGFISHLRNPARFSATPSADSEKYALGDRADVVMRSGRVGKLSIASAATSRHALENYVCLRL